jgi:hypothetical protein
MYAGLNSKQEQKESLYWKARRHSYLHSNQGTCICMYVCIHVCLYVGMSMLSIKNKEFIGRPGGIHTYIQTKVRVSVCMHVRMYVCMRAFVLVIRNVHVN